MKMVSSRNHSQRRVQSPGPSSESSRSPDCTYVIYEHHKPQNKGIYFFKKRHEVSLSCFINIPVDILYEIFTFLHPQDLLNLSRATWRLRLLLMSRGSRFAWKAALANVVGMPFCPQDLTEPQFASLAFDQHCHFCLSSVSNDIFWSCRVRCCQTCLSKYFLSKSELLALLPVCLLTFKVNAIFPFTIYPKATGRALYLKATVEAYLQELGLVDKNDDKVLPRWYASKRQFQNEIMSHAALCEHWTAYWTLCSSQPHTLHDVGITVALAGFLLYLWKDQLFHYL